jgi:hypothetical protein
MPNFSFNTELIRAKLGAEVADEFTKMENALNLVSKQTNANPVGPVEKPPQIAAVTAKVLTPGVHSVQIQDNSPINRGITYHFEASETPGFENAVLVQSGPSRDLPAAALGGGKIYWRAYSQYPTSDPSQPVYFGGQQTPKPVDAGGTARTSPITSAGSGTEPSLNPQLGAGFGFDTDRVPTTPKGPE